MHGLQVFDTKALQVLLRRRDTRVPQDPRKVEQVATGSKVAHGESVSECVKAHPDAGDVEPLAKILQPSSNISLVQSTTLE